MLKKAFKIIIAIIVVFISYEIVAFSTHLLKPLVVAPFTLIEENPSSSQLLWYQNIHYLISSPQQMDMVLFQDQIGNRRVGVVETIISTESKKDRLYRVRLFLKSDGNYFITVPGSAIVGEILPSNKLITKIKSDKFHARLVVSNSIAPILQKIQKTTITTSTPFVWNKPRINSMQYPFFLARNSDGYGILIQNVLFIELATTTDLSMNSNLSNQIMQLLNQTLTSNQFQLTKDKPSPFSPDFSSFQFTNNEYICSGSINRVSQIQLPYEENKVMTAAKIDLSSAYWSIKLACVTRKEFENADKLSKPFREDFGADFNSAIYVYKISGDYAVLGYNEMVFAHKINGHWKIIWRGNGNPDCSEMERLVIPADIYGECIQ